MAKFIHLIEDDEDIRFIIEYVLLEEGYEVEAFATATAFYRSLHRQKPNLIILDVMLPDGNGINICRTLKSDTETLNIPIIIMSAHAAEKSALDEAGADDFISKPFDLNHFIHQVKGQLSA
ncbi:response regulator [Pedobacter hiemivivus]|uniref:Response regulator n=1 Tax=Pedobacter hiemivivus TaxID=2530454 RepID=A0A4U1G1V5_9SPHI|nr:response regulator [Pedobacter hiemivivus]TCC92689.1 response regulator [Pedobacter hiemivivus]TKC56243.1 response regulator [Pedobacter hiemivivus]